MQRVRGNFRTMSKKPKIKKIKQRQSNIWLAIGLITLISVGIYYNSLNAPFIFDDISKIVNNPDIKNLKIIKSRLIYPYGKYKKWERNDPSRPLIYFTFALNYHFGKLNVFGYHLVNIFFHIVNSVLILFLSQKIILYIYKKEFLLFSFFVSLLFTVHPINIDAVTYIFARSNILATCFYLLSILLFIRTFEINRKLYFFSLVCFILSLASKPIAVTFPAIILVFDYVFLNDFNMSKTIKKMQYHLPFWSILIFYLLFRHFYLGGIGDIDASKDIWPRYFYILTQPYVILRYLQLLFVPIGLCIAHSIVPIKSIFEYKFLLSSLLVIGILMFGWILYKKNVKNSVLILFSILWFFITLLPTSSFFPTAIALSERRLYLPGFGIYFIIMLIFFYRSLNKNIYTIRHNWISICLFAIYICALGVTTYRRNNLYRSPVLIWEDAVAKYPKNPGSIANACMAHHKLGSLYYSNKQYKNVIKEYERIIELDPSSGKICYNEIGSAYYLLGEYNKAIQEYKKVIKLDPNYVDAYNNLGAVYFEINQYRESIKEFEKAIELDPNDADTYRNIGLVYFEGLQDYQKTIFYWQKYLQLNPNASDSNYIRRKIERLKNRKNSIKIK